MINNLLKIFAIIVLAILQLTLMPHFSIAQVWPNLILLIALILAMLEFETESLLVAALGGLILDLASPLFFGFYSLTLIGLVLLTKLLLTKLLTEPNFLITALFLALAAGFHDLLIQLVTRNFSWIMVLVNAGYSGLIGTLLFHGFERWFKKQPLIKIS